MSDVPLEASPTVESVRQRMEFMDLQDATTMIEDEEENDPTQLEEEMLHHEAYPMDDRFFETFEELVQIEFQHRGVAVQDALYEMWLAHLYRFGDCCNEACECFDELGEMSNSVYYANLRSMNFLKCFLPRFLPLLKKEYPVESRQQLCNRLKRIWNRHCAFAVEPAIKDMQLPCTNETCRCSDSWDFQFNRGVCSPCYSVSIHEEMDSIREFRTKFAGLVLAEFETTEFPDACNFALGRMWQLHVHVIGELCGATCPCWKNVSEFGTTVLHEMLMRKESLNWDNPMQFDANSVPTGALLCYAKADTLGVAITTQTKDRQALDEFLSSWPATTGGRCRPDCCCRV